MSYAVRFTRSARADLVRLYDFLLAEDLAAAQRARGSIGKAIEMLADFPFACRKHDARNPFLRELLIPFGAAGYVALFEIEDSRTVTILAIRQQREDDYR